MSRKLFRLDSDEENWNRHPFQLEELQLLSVRVFDPADNALKVPKSLLYYREPKAADYPLDLNEGYENYIFRNKLDHMILPNSMQYIMDQNREDNVVKKVQFCTSRRALLNIMSHAYLKRQHSWIAMKYHGCIYLKPAEENQEPHCEALKLRSTYQYKMRQFVFADSPGGKPNTKKPVDENKQLYAIYTAKLGDFNLIYSAEISGLDNSEVLGDMTDPKVVEKCKPVAIKVYKGTRSDLKRDDRMAFWVSQAYLGGFEKIKVGLFGNQGLIRDRIEEFQCADHYKIHDISRRVQQMHLFLSEISKFMLNIDDPHTVVFFHLAKNGKVTYRKIPGPNSYSFLHFKYVEFIDNLYT